MSIAIPTKLASKMRSTSIPDAALALPPKGSIEPPKELLLDVDWAWAEAVDDGDCERVKLGSGAEELGLLTGGTGV